MNNVKSALSGADFFSLGENSMWSERCMLEREREWECPYDGEPTPFTLLGDCVMHPPSCPKLTRKTAHGMILANNSIAP